MTNKIALKYMFGENEEYFTQIMEDTDENRKILFSCLEDSYNFAKEKIFTDKDKVRGMKYLDYFEFFSLENADKPNSKCGATLYGCELVDYLG